MVFAESNSLGVIWFTSYLQQRATWKRDVLSQTCTGQHSGRDIDQVDICLAQMILWNIGACQDHGDVGGFSVQS